MVLFSLFFRAAFAEPGLGLQQTEHWDSTQQLSWQLLHQVGGFLRSTSMFALLWHQQ
jgi:hypothetical protein